MRRAITLTVALVATLPACSGDDAAAPNSTGYTTTGTTNDTTTDTNTDTTPVVEPVATSVPAAVTTAAVVSTSSTTEIATVASPGDWCAVAEDLYGLTTAFRQLDAGNTGAVQMSLIAILERLDVIAELVPPHLAGDLGVSAQAFEMLDAALAEVGYDVDAADLSALDTHTAEIAAANDRIRAYNADACGIAIDVTGEGAP